MDHQSAAKGMNVRKQEKQREIKTYNGRSGNKRKLEECGQVLRGL
jgi:hypothetical protein